MARFKNYLLVILGFAFAGAIGAAFGTGTAQAVVSTLVTAVNTSGNPVQVQHVPADNPATQAVSLICGFGSGQGGCNLINGSFQNPPYVVPSGKRLVVESISGTVLFATGQKFPVFYTIRDNAPQDYTFFPPLAFVYTIPSSLDLYSWGLSVKLYAEQGTSITVGTQGPSSIADFYAFGHLENIQ